MSAPITTHMPGPWTWFVGKDVADRAQPHIKFFIDGNGQGFAHTVGLEEPVDTANARLIAAAPELLEALRHMETCQSCAQADWSACPRGGQQAIAAIAKAEGRS